MALKKTAAAKKTPGTQVVKWDEEMEKYAQAGAKMVENLGGGGQFFSTKGGVLTWQDAPMPDNQMAVVILDSLLVNVFYESKYDADNPSSPTCYALGRDEKTMAPHKIVVEAGNAQCGASGLCNGCEQNEWGTADTGRGKACQNRIRLAMIPAGTLKANKLEMFDDPDEFSNATIGYLQLPVMSVKGYASFVKNVKETLKRPTFGVVTKVKVVPDASAQFKVTFEPLTEIDTDLLPVIHKRYQEAAREIDFPFPVFDEEPKPAARGAKTKARPAAKKTSAGTRPAVNSRANRQATAAKRGRY